MDHLQNFDEQLSQQLRKQPADFLPAFERAVQNVYRNNYHDLAGSGIAGIDTVPTFQVQVSSDENPRMLRDLQSSLMGQLVVIPGIITASSKTGIRATSVTWTCTSCGHEKTVRMKFGFGGTSAPRTCESNGSAIPGVVN